MKPTTAPRNEVRAGPPLTAATDLDDFAAGLARYGDGLWHEDRWRTFRLRFGVYEQRQSGQHMVRAKIPSGRLTFAQLRGIADAARHHTGGDVHITTRQNVQFYHIRLDQVFDLLTALHRAGVTTREASGNTFRNVTACPLAGICPSERVDAADAAQRLAANWLRDPLTQHMPRKVKMSVSGCEQDCGLTRIDDLGFIATRRAGRNGFCVVAGGGLGTHPRNAVEVLEFVSESDLPTVQEALARLHHAQSDRSNKNRSRIKFLVDRIGAEGFRAAFQKAFYDLRARPRDASEAGFAPLVWRDDAPGDTPPAPLAGVIAQRDGRQALLVDVPLGWISARALEALADMAEKAGAVGVVLTRDQNILLHGLPAGTLDALQSNLRSLGLGAGGEAHAMRDLVACPGVATCAIGITASSALAADLLAAKDEFGDLPSVAIKVSGCHNSCGQHHAADIGLHGLAKKIDGKSAPHYRLHIGGAHAPGAVSGPVLPARLVKPAIRALLLAMRETRLPGETVHAWAARIGEDGIDNILSTLPRPAAGDGINWHVDIGETATFVPPVRSTAECAAGAMVGEHLSDLAAVARADITRASAAGDIAATVDACRRAIVSPAARLLAVAGQTAADGGELAAVRDQWSHDETLMHALNAAEAAIRDGDGTIELLAAWQVEAERVVEDILRSVARHLSRSAAE